MLLNIIFFGTVFGANGAAIEPDLQASVTHKLQKYSAPGAVHAPELARNIILQSYAMGMDAHMVASIVLAESRGVASAVNMQTHDYGLMQINYKTAAALGISDTCLADWRCNLKSGMAILKHSNPICRYNVGTSVLKGNTLQKCRAYSARIAILD